MKISNLSALMLSALMLVGITSCSNDITDDSKDVPGGGGSALFLAPSISQPEGEEAPLLRSTFYDGKNMGVYFDWAEGDVVGIFPIKAKASQQKYNCESVIATAEEAEGGVSRAYFKPENADFEWDTQYEYRAYYPYNSGNLDIASVLMDFTGQMQTGKPDMGNYYAGDQENYYATEKTASAHLTAKSFLLSAPSQPREDDNKALPFQMSYLGGIVRFFLTLPQDIDADITEIRLVATKPVFHEKAKLNVLAGTTAPSGEASNNLVLNLEDVHLQYNSATNAYGNILVAYMMAYPVALTSNEVLGTTGKLYIYVKGNDGGKDVYFRSGAITKKDIAAGALTQFSVKPTDKDDPIEVQPINVQEWQAGLTLDNDGKGTGEW